MVLNLSIHNACRHRPPQQLLSASLDGPADEEKATTPSEQSQVRPLPLVPVQSRLINRLIQGLTIQLSVTAPPQKRIQVHLNKKDGWMVPTSTTTTDAAPKISKNMPPTRTGLSELTFANTRMLRNNNASNKKHVHFSAIHIREHAITVGDHDWCEGSLPIQLDWQHTATRSISLDDFEWQRERQGRTPRGRLPKLDFAQRKRLLRRVSGITEEDLLLLERQHIDSKYVTLHCSKTVTMYQR
mmetsp:Transcript_118741/g.332552  ORF Transcript_118741/g.332552 Transcript_118741/m.332552 type:complete len:242 (+) Transcript_118741:93-818(+)